MLTNRSVPQDRPSDIDVFVAQPITPEPVTPAMMIGIFTNLLDNQPFAEPGQRDRWRQRLVYWRRVAAADAEVQREGWAAVGQGLWLDEGVRR